MCMNDKVSLKDKLGSLGMCISAYSPADKEFSEWLFDRITYKHSSTVAEVYDFVRMKSLTILTLVTPMQALRGAGRQLTVVYTDQDRCFKSG